MHKIKIIRTSTVPGSLTTFCKPQLKLLKEQGYEVVAVSSPGKDLTDMGRELGIDVRQVPMQRHIALRKDLRSLWQMWRLLRRERPRMVHSMTPKAGLISMLAARLAGVPVRVHTFTGLIWPTAQGNTRRILVAVDRLLCACATHIIPEGTGVADDMRRARITSKPLQPLAHGNVRGIDGAYYDRTAHVKERASELKKTWGGAPVFLFVGRVVADKGIAELVRAFKALQVKHPDAKLVLVGRPEPELDPLPPEVTAEIAANPAIIAVGQQDDVRPYMAAADVLVFPSYREGFPNVVLEAGAMGLPCIVTDINGSREIIADGFNGLIVSPHDADALLAAMSRLADDKALRTKMAGVARDHVLSRWSDKIVNQALLDFYASVLKPHVK